MSKPHYIFSWRLRQWELVACAEYTSFVKRGFPVAVPV